MERRTFIESIGIAGVGALAGCAAPSAPDATTQGNGDDGGAGGEATATETTAGEAATETTTGGGGGGGGAPNTVEMVTEGSEYYFDPVGLFVEPGETISFVNQAGAHSSTAYAEGNGGAEVRRIPQDAEAWNSEILTESGASFDHTFEVTGTYDYFCIPHKTLGMVGRLVVGEPGGPAEGSTPPDGDVPTSETIVEQGAVSYSEFSG